MAWDRLAWGVRFTSSLEERPLLLGEAWHDEARLRGKAFPGELTRALVFQTRALARAWCQAEQAKYVGRQDCCATWRFRPVRVRERVSEVRGRRR